MPFGITCLMRGEIYDFDGGQMGVLDMCKVNDRKAEADDAKHKGGCDFDALVITIFSFIKNQ